MTKQIGAVLPRIGFYKFAQAIKADPGWSPAQRALIKSVDFIEPLSPDEAAAYRKMTGLKPYRPGTEAPRFNAWVLSRGGGKTSLAALSSLYDILSCQYRQKPGETVLAAIMSPSLRQARDAARYVTSYCESELVAPFVESATTDEIRFTSGRRIRCIPVAKNASRVRGATLISFVADEVAFFEHSGALCDREIFNGVIAGFRNVNDYRVLLISTPNGRTGLLFDVYEGHWGKADGKWSVMHAPVDIVRPNMDAHLLQQIRESDPESYAIEFECKFTTGGAQRFFVPDAVERNIQEGINHVPAAATPGEYYAAVDVSGGSIDKHAVSVVRRLEDGRIQQVASLFFDPKKEKYSMREAARATAELCAEYGVSTIACDVYGGKYSVEAHAEFGLTVNTVGMNATLKMQRARAMLELLENDQLMLLDIPEQTDEILRYERRVLPSGNVTCGHPLGKNGSDDLLDALLLAMYEALGNQERLHPPDALKRFSDRAFSDMYQSGDYPAPGGDLTISAAEIAQRGEGPRWVISNWSRDWRYCQCSPSELAWLCGIGPSQILNQLGRDTVRQLLWMRWLLAYHGVERGDIDFVLSIQSFPAIPGFRAVQKRIRETGSFKRIVTYSAGDPGDCKTPWGWDIPYDIVSGPHGYGPPISSDEASGVSRAPAYPPWVRPNHQWPLGIPHDDEIYDWPKRPWTDAVEDIFTKGDRQRREKGTHAALVSEGQFKEALETERGREKREQQQQNGEGHVLISGLRGW